LCAGDVSLQTKTKYCGNQRRGSSYDEAALNRGNFKRGREDVFMVHAMGLSCFNPHPIFLILLFYKSSVEHCGNTAGGIE
jgi:hypothetical protein